MKVTVVPAEGENEVAFLGNIPESIRAYESLTLDAAYFENGVQTEEEVAYQVSGGYAMSYSFTQDGNRLHLSCWTASTEPVMITAKAGGCAASIKLRLEGL